MEEEFNLDEIDGDDLVNDLSIQIAQLTQRDAILRQQLTRARRRIHELSKKLAEFGVETAEAKTPPTETPNVTLSTKPTPRPRSPRKSTTRKKAR